MNKYCMNPFLESPENRIKIWRDFRRTLTSDTSDLDQLKLIIDFFSQSPESKISLDVDRPETWLTPWELLYEGKFCPNVIGYLMEQTLLYSECKRWTSERVKLALIDDKEYNYLKLMVIIDQKYVLNHEYNMIGDWQKIQINCRILHSYEFNSLKRIHRFSC